MAPDGIIARALVLRVAQRAFEQKQSIAETTDEFGAKFAVEEAANHIKPSKIGANKDG